MHVSVVIPAYNGSLYIKAAVDSVLRQTDADFSVVVVDDGSTDDTAAIIRGIGDSRLSLVTQRNGGVASARNRGIASSSADLVAFLDQDDLWAPTKLATQKPFFCDPDVGVVGSFMTYLGAKGPMRATAGEMADGQRDRIARAKLMPFPPSSMIIRRSVFDAVGGFDEELVRRVGPIDDLDLLSRVARGYEIKTVPEPLGYYRVHSGAGTFARFSDMQRGTRFLQARIIDPSVEWESWVARDSTSFRQRRKQRSRFLYRTAGMYMGSGNRLRGAGALLAAGLLDPAYTVPRLRRQLKATSAE